MSNRLHEDISALVPEPLSARPDGLTTLRMAYEGAEVPTDSAVVLAAVVANLSIPIRKANEQRFGFNETYDVRHNDKKQADAFFDVARGMGTMDFTWHAAPGFAVAAVHTFIDAGVLTREQQQNFTLHDWANIIGTGWFSRLTHSLAFAVNAPYRSFGMSGGDLQSNGLRNCLTDIGVLQEGDQTQLFDVKEELEPVEDMFYTTASASAGLTKALRATFKTDELRAVPANDKSPGCPGARFATTMPADMVHHDRHVRSLINRGELVIDEARSTSDKVRVTQEYSAIDHSLILLAAKLDQYQNLHGMPQVEIFAEGGPAIYHTENMQDVDALRRKAAQEADSL